MTKNLIAFAGSMGLVAMLAVPSALNAAMYNSARSAQSFSNVYRAETDQNGNVTVRMTLPGITTQRFQNGDPGSPEVVSALINPQNRNRMYLSVRLREGERTISKIYRYYMDTGEMERLYREDGGRGYTILGFDGMNRLIVTPADYQGDRPGQCWEDERLAEGSNLKYLDLLNPRAGLRDYTPDANFRDLRQKALNACRGQ